MLKAVGEYNNFPEGFPVPEIPDEPTTVVYQFLDHLKFKEPPGNKDRWKSSVQIQPIARIMYKKKPLLVGLVGSVDKDGKADPYSIRRINFEPAASDGKIFLQIAAGVPANDELYQYLELCNENEDNPYRDPSVHPLFKKKDYVKEAEDALDKDLLEIDAAAHAAGLKPAEQKQYAAILGINPVNEYGTALPKAKIDHLYKAALVKFAKANAKEFLDMKDDADRETKAIIARGLDNGTFKIDTENLALTREGGELMKLVAGTSRKQTIAQFLEHIKGQDNPGQVINAFKSFVDAKDKANNKA